MKTIPKFKNEDEESQFWLSNDSTEYLDWKEASKAVFPNLKPSVKRITLNIPDYLLGMLKQEANKINIPMNSLVKILLKEGLEKRFKRA